MFRFAIRDVLWLTVVVAVVTLLCSDRIAIKKERTLLQAERALLTEEIAAKRAAFNKDVAKMAEFNQMLNARKRSMENDIESRARILARQYERPPSQDELEASKRASAKLGAPQPKPLLPGYGETPNQQ